MPGKRWVSPTSGISGNDVEVAAQDQGALSPLSGISRPFGNEVGAFGMRTNDFGVQPK